MKYYKISEQLLEHLVTRCNDSIQAYDEIINNPDKGYCYAAGFYKATVETVKILIEAEMNYAEESNQ